ncbi:MAG: helix-turn-helix domain-containing protein [Lachnospiraceae bacterium]|jgi:DNA-binding transcriptional MerR regulator|nr:helix-turn-helix domain-containing protein [Lachnospiraceae bacterium]
MSNVLLISDAAKEVHVESHVLRYWEEELHLPIKRNELGHRYYTKEDVDRFKQIKGMKERGLQLKAIKMILKDGKLDVITSEENKAKQDELQISDIDTDTEPSTLDILSTPNTQVASESREDKARRLQWLLQQLIRETLLENNKELTREIKETVVKEMDYQFRLLEEREEERSRTLDQRSDEYYKKMDELLRTKSRGRKAEKLRKDSPDQSLRTELDRSTKKEKRKRRSLE